MTTPTPTATAPSAQTDRFVHDRLPPQALLPELRYPLPGMHIPAQANLVDTLFSKAFANGHGDRPMLRSDRITLSYAEALERVNRIAQVLTEDCKLVPGNRVLLRGGNSIGMALAWLGVVQAGLVAVATMPLLRAKELGEIIEKAQPTVAICDATLLDELAQAQVAHPVLGTVLKFNALGDPQDLGALCAAKSGNSRPAPPRPTTSP